MEAGRERIGRELGDSYPSLCANIHMTNLENPRRPQHGGRRSKHFGDRLGSREPRRSPP